jgi:hypothetical protein
VAVDGGARNTRGFRHPERRNRIGTFLDEQLARGFEDYRPGTGNAGIVTAMTPTAMRVSFWSVWHLT